MAKETFYFSHDYNARSDEKIKKLIRKHGMAGYGVFWCLVEDLYNNANALLADYDGIAYDLRVDAKMIESIINDFNLFVIEDKSFGSSSIEDRLDERNQKSEKARKSAFKRWNKKDNNANAMQTQCDSNAIKESKVNKSKVKESIVLPFDSKKFKDKWDLWKAYRIEIKKPIKGKISEQSTLIKLSELSNGNEEIACKIIEQSISNNWQGLFELKNTNNGKQTSTLKQQILDRMEKRCNSSQED